MPLSLPSSLPYPSWWWWWCGAPPPSSPTAEGVVRLNKKEKKEQGLTYAPVALLVIALPVAVVPGMGIAAAEVVRMKERKKRVGGTHCCPRHHPTRRRGHRGRGRGWARGHGCGRGHGRRRRRHGGCSGRGGRGGHCVMVVVGMGRGWGCGWWWWWWLLSRGGGGSVGCCGCRFGFVDVIDVGTCCPNLCN